MESDDYKVKDFSLTVTSADLTGANISYKLGNKVVNFSGNSVIKVNKQ